MNGNLASESEQESLRHINKIPCDPMWSSVMSNIAFCCKYRSYQ